MVPPRADASELLLVLLLQLFGQRHGPGSFVLFPHQLLCKHLREPMALLGGLGQLRQLGLRTTSWKEHESSVYLDALVGGSWRPHLELGDPGGSDTATGLTEDLRAPATEEEGRAGADARPQEGLGVSHTGLHDYASPALEGFHVR